MRANSTMFPCVLPQEPPVGTATVGPQPQPFTPCPIPTSHFPCSRPENSRAFSRHEHTLTLITGYDNR
jgi:hypothetical protein